MGNSDFRKSSFQQHNWRKVDEKQNKVILYNDILMKSVQKHYALLDCDEGEIVSMCKWRESLPQDYCIVQLYEYGIRKPGVCNRFSQVYVITQRIHLFSEIGAISKAQAFLLIRDVATGLKILFQKFGMFSALTCIIGINSYGRAKVWTNQNFAHLNPINQDIPLQSELEVVNNLLKIVSTKTYADTDHNMLNFPFNLDLNSVINYINRVFTSLKGFQVDRIYIDRIQFAKKYKELCQLTQKEQQQRMLQQQFLKRVREMELLNQNLKLKQMELSQKERKIKSQQEKFLQINQQLQLPFIPNSIPLQNRVYQREFFSDPQKHLKGSTNSHQSNQSEMKQHIIIKGPPHQIPNRIQGFEFMKSRLQQNQHQKEVKLIQRIQRPALPPLPPVQYIPTLKPRVIQKEENQRLLRPHSSNPVGRIKREIQMVDSMFIPDYNREERINSDRRNVE